MSCKQITNSFFYCYNFPIHVIDKSCTQKSNFKKMIHKFSYFFFLLFLLSNNACTDNYDTGIRHPNKNVHGYESEHDHAHEEEMKANSRLQEKYQDTGFSADGSNRWIWQKPNVIIEKLQPLDGKVVADIGAGPYGYFAFRIVHQAAVEKVIAIDIDPEAAKFMEETKQLLSENIANRIETRLVGDNDPQLKEGEADVILIVNTIAYFNDRLDYFKRLHKGLAKGGKMVIVDFKKRNTPVGPPATERVSLGQVERELQTTGYQRISVDDRSLEYQYIITAMKE